MREYINLFENIDERILKLAALDVNLTNYEIYRALAVEYCLVAYYDPKLVYLINLSENQIRPAFSKEQISTRSRRSFLQWSK